jgi:hypothetical protein
MNSWFNQGTMPTVLSGNWEKSRRTSVSTVYFPDEVRMRHLPDKRLEIYRHTNTLLQALFAPNLHKSSHLNEKDYYPSRCKFSGWKKWCQSHCAGWTITRPSENILQCTTELSANLGTAHLPRGVDSDVILSSIQIRGLKCIYVPGWYEKWILLSCKRKKNLNLIQYLRLLWQPQIISSHLM